MSYQNLRKRTEGFTIIEVLIVLAIAGLIMLVVFMAVPALQRNSRNTSRKNDVAAILGAITDYTANNNGKAPTSLTDLGISKTSYYSGDGTAAGNIKFTTTTSETKMTAEGKDDRVIIAMGHKCGTLVGETTVRGTVTPANISAVASAARAVAILYQEEGSDGKLKPTCQQS